MRLIDILTGNDNSTPDNEPDGYRVVRKTDKGGWKPVEPFDQLDEPITKQTFEYNASPIDPGEYRLFVLNGNLQTELSGEQGWKLEVEGNTDRNAEQDEKIAELRREIKSMCEEQTGSSSQHGELNPEEANKKEKASLQLAALQSEPFRKHCGEKAALAMFGIPSGSSESSVEDDDWQDDSVGASIVKNLQKMSEEPEQSEHEKETIGNDIDSFLSGAADQQREQDKSVDHVDSGRSDEQSDENEPPELRDVDAGPSSMAELEAKDGYTVDVDELREEIIQARAN